jgi:hypothetical protein
MTVDITIKTDLRPIILVSCMCEKLYKQLLPERFFRVGRDQAPFQC